MYQPFLLPSKGLGAHPVCSSDIKRGTQRTLSDLPGATPKRSRLRLEDNSRNQVSACQDDDRAPLNSASTSIDTSTVLSTSTGQDTDANHTTDDHVTDSSMTEGTTVATFPNDIANTRDCGPVHPMIL